VFASNLRRLRHARGLSQEVLAFEADVNRTYMSKLEKGASYPDLRLSGSLPLYSKSNPPNYSECSREDACVAGKTTEFIGCQPEGCTCLESAISWQVERSLYPQKRTFAALPRNDAKGHVWTAPAVQEESDVCEAFGCSHVSGLFSPGGLPPSRCGRCGRWP
jgi:DNA-binding XRE family transcriptional regulator